MSDIYDIIIIGGGPAGMSAGIYSARAGYKTLLIEKVGYGGQMMLTDTVDNYPGFPDGITGFELQERMLKQMKKFGIDTVTDDIMNITKKDNLFTISSNKKDYIAYSAIIASGAHHRTLNIPGEKEFAARGVSYCGTCDGPFFRDKELIVVGGGDTAITEAIFLSKFAKKISIIHRKDRFRAIKSLVDQTDKIEKINYVFNTVITEINGEDKVKSVVLKNTKTNEIIEKEIDGVFIFVGLLPNTDFIDSSLLDDSNHIITDIKMGTKIKGLYAAGDVRSGAFRQIICATANGATASEYAGKYVDEIKGVAYK